MFGELPKLFDRDFAIAYILPSAAFIEASHFLLTHLGVVYPRFILSQNTLLSDLTAFGLLALLGAIVLSVLNRGLVRLLEGYWPLRHYLNFAEKLRYRWLMRQDAKSDKDREKYSSATFPQKLRNRRNKIKRKKVEQFPTEEKLILPTSFGNIYRAFEIYSGAIYGLDAIPGWYRLMAVVPKDYRALIDAGRARVDLWVNTSFVGLLITFEYYGVVFWALDKDHAPTGWLSRIPIFSLLGAYIAYRLAKNAAIEWGHWVKSAFDLYIPDLREALELTVPATNDQEKAMWIAFSRMAIYRDAAAMPAKSRKTPATSNDSNQSAQLLALNELLIAKRTLELLLQDVSSSRRG